MRSATVLLLFPLLNWGRKWQQSNTDLCQRWAKTTKHSIKGHLLRLPYRLYESNHHLMDKTKKALPGVKVYHLGCVLQGVVINFGQLVKMGQFKEVPRPCKKTSFRTLSATQPGGSFANDWDTSMSEIGLASRDCLMLLLRCVLFVLPCSICGKNQVSWNLKCTWVVVCIHPYKRCNL